MYLRIWLMLLLSSALAGCDKLGIETPATEAARHEADSKAIGGGCRHAGRAIEDCYVINPDASRAAVFAGWRDMDDYMRENKLSVVAPSVAPDKPPPPPAKRKRKDHDGGTDDAAEGEGHEGGKAGEAPGKPSAAKAASPQEVGDMLASRLGPNANVKIKPLVNGKGAD